MWRCSRQGVRLLRRHTLYLTRRTCTSTRSVSSSSTTDPSLCEQLQRMAQEIQNTATPTPSPAWQRALELVQANTASKEEDAVSTDENTEAVLEWALYICLQDARINTNNSSSLPPAELCRTLYTQCHARRCCSSGEITNVGPFAGQADMYRSYAQHLWRSISIHSTNTKEAEESTNMLVIQLTVEMLRVLLLDAPQGGSRDALRPASLRLVLQGLCELQKYNALEPETAESDDTQAGTNDSLLLLHWLQRPCEATDLENDNSSSTMSRAVRQLYVRPWCNADEVALQCLHQTTSSSSYSYKPPHKGGQHVGALLLYVHYALQRMQVHCDELERQVCRLTHTTPRYTHNINETESEVSERHNGEEERQVAPALQSLLTCLLQLKQQQHEVGGEESERNVRDMVLHALVRPMPTPTRTATTTSEGNSNSSNKSSRPRFVLAVWVVRTLLAWVQAAQDPLVHPAAHHSEEDAMAALHTWQVRSYSVVMFLRDFMLALPIHRAMHVNKRGIDGEDAALVMQTSQAMWRAVIDAAIEGVFANTGPTAGTSNNNIDSSENSITMNVNSSTQLKNVNATSLVMQELLLPLYDEGHWRWQTVNRYVRLLHQWEMHGALRAVFTAIQRKEAWTQRHYNNYLRQTQHESENNDTASSNVQPIRYRPALTMSSCRYIFESCCNALRDPHTAAELVRYMLLVLRVAQTESNTSNTTSSEEATQISEDEEKCEEEEVSVEGEPLRQWVAWITNECIPVVGQLFEELGLDKQGDWLERY